MRDLALAFRSLARKPTFTLAVVTTLGLSLGVTTGFFGVISALLLRPMPGVNSRNLVSLHVKQVGENDPFSGFSRPTFVDLKERSRSLDGMEGFVGRGFALETGSEAPSLDTGGATNPVVTGQLVSGGFFGFLGTKPLLGRLLNPGDDRPGAPPVAVITSALWRQRFSGRADVIGKTLRLNGRPFAVVGVAETGFRGHFVGFPLDVYVPLTAANDVAFGVSLDDRADQSLEIIGRLREGMTLGAAESELRAIAADLERLYPDQLRGQSVELHAFSGLDADLRGPVIGFMGLLAVVGILILLVATVNIGGLLLARGVSRAREMAVRSAIGASRADLARPLLAETFVLFALGGALGLTLVHPAALAMHSFLPDFAVPLHVEVAVDWRVALFAIAITTLSGVFFGLGPAARAAQVDVVTALKSGGRGVASGSGRARQTFVTAQVALSMVLLFGAGLFLRELQQARAFDPGFRTTDIGLVSVDVSLLGRGETPALDFFETWLERARALPGVEEAALVRQAPLGLGGATTLVQVDGIEAPSPDGFRTGWNAVGPGYFQALEVPFVAGRDFSDTDTLGGDQVAILSRAAAARFFANGDALGRSIHRNGQALRIVGVVEDVAVDRSGRRDRLFVFQPFAQSETTRATLLLRAQGPLPFPEIRLAARDLLPGLPILSVGTLAERALTALFPQRLAAAVTGASGGFALLLASIGLHALIAFFVEEKRYELAVRSALGADRFRLRIVALKQGLLPVARGLAIGGVAALGLGRVVGGFLPAVGGSDPLALLGAAMLLLVVAFVASDLPARRAADAAPVDALRSE